MIQELMEDAETRMEGAITALQGDLASFRTGRASPQLLDRIVVEMYGVDVPLIQLASVSVPEPQQLAIRPYDVNSIKAIERAIMTSDLGIMPNNDGKIIRLNLPRLTEERRRDLSKLVGKRVEEAKIAIRNVRRDILSDIRDLESEKMISEDEMHRQQDKVQEMTDKYTSEIDKIGTAKEAEIMEV